MIAAQLIRAAPVAETRPWARRVFTPPSWHLMAEALAATPDIALLAMWADTAQIHALLLDPAVPEVLPVSVPVENGVYPALSPARPAAAWYERMIHDLWGHAANGGRDLRPWLDHGRWDLRHPLAVRPGEGARLPQPPEFLPAEGPAEGPAGGPAEGMDLHVVPVGPIHAGIIEAGHFRFTCAGETIVRLELRHGWKHRGITPRAAARFAARRSGEATGAAASRCARAAAAATATPAPPRAQALRAVMAELERIANHCNDVGAICHDVAFPFLQARLSWHREKILRAVSTAFGHRLMMDCVVPGGVAADIAPDALPPLLETLGALLEELPELTRVYDDYASLADRLTGTGRLPPALAAAFAPGGVVGRAAGQTLDGRLLPHVLPDDTMPRPRPITLGEGDVDARTRLRLLELPPAIALVRSLLGSLPDGPLAVVLPQVAGEGYGAAESFRGDCWAWLRLDAGVIAAGFLADPSWRQWPLLEAAVIGNIIADFPVINKSFNCSYAGIDL
jgi:Ni,Fe-hydrogenase III large subunit